jgi:ketosteroid isomerase-like protein
MKTKLICNNTKAKVFIILMVVVIMSISACIQKNNEDIATIKAEVLKTVYLHNKAWTELEDLNEQKKYIHDKIVFIAPPYKEPVKGKEAYLVSYKDWIDHATVHHFQEINPEVYLYNDGKFAVVTYKIDMAFDFDETKVPEWHGIDTMTLVKEKGKWLITSDMYAKQKIDGE